MNRRLARLVRARVALAPGRQGSEARRCVQELLPGRPIDTTRGFGMSQELQMGPEIAVDEALSPAEQALLERSLDGDVEAFAALFQRYRSALLGRSLGILRDRAAAEDIVQETFIRAYRNLSNFERDRRLWPWLATIAHRLSLNVLRDRRRIDSNADPDPGASLVLEPSRDLTVETATANEARARLARALQELPDRQRRVLLLFALEGWTHADIAQVEHSSVSSVKNIIYRARIALRDLLENSVVGVALAPVGVLRERLRAAARAGREKVRGAVDGLRRRSNDLANQGMLMGGQHAFAAGILAATVVVGAIAPGASGPTPDGRVGSSDTRVLSTSIPAASVSSDAGAPAERSEIGGSEPTPSSSQEDLQRFADYALDPTANASPENTQFKSVVVSSEGSSHRTVYAAGMKECPTPPCHVLFASNDGGATWRRASAEGFSGYTLLLPPGGGDTIFAMSSSGLQKSTDAGETFAPVSSASGNPAISPMFDQGDPRILIGSATLQEYRDDTGRTVPAGLLVPAAAQPSVAFSPDYRNDGLVLVGAMRPDPTRNFMQSFVYRCEETEACPGTALPGSVGAPQLRPSPRFGEDGLMYAFQSAILARSDDGGRSWLRTPIPADAWSGIRDVVLRSDPSSGKTTVFVAAVGIGGAQGGIYRSDDGGTTWAVSPVSLEGFYGGAGHLALVDTGSSTRILAAGALHGIACSDDLGVTWSKRCQPLGA